MKKILYILLAGTFLLGCSNDDKLSGESGIIPDGGGDERSLNPQNDLDKYIEQNFTKPYSIDIIYRFLEREIYRAYTFAPTRYEKAVEFVNVFNYLFVEPYIKITSKQFLKEHSFNTIILIGEPAFNPTGAKLVGFASAGIKIHLLEINHTQPNNIYWLNDNILVTLYHENAHTWHQAKLYPTDYERISATDYKRDSWVNAWNLNTSNFLPAGFMTAYSSFNSDEDFVEMLARYIVYYNATLDCGCATSDETRWGKNQTNTQYHSIPDGFDYELYTEWKNKFWNYGNLYNDQSVQYESSYVWEERLKAADTKIRETETYTGKQKIEQKMAIMKKYLLEEWNINLDELRAEIRSRYPYVVGKDFEGNPVQRKDFSVLPNN
ncbi:substrate import-associated zinc metallohydrolase lipoprotein [Capnocytophaga sp. oral taxon 338]|jgi:hypothetical protein|uniref:substrate import-associated zinc metallohydrolase lipoprotein n=1 Tax=Capnocytophaga sp. oral taxon 338 TaxID=710239 RepID=UPI000202F16D|nr:substrate import-associated zinc metallohydrolase lipoprotein [Capnocytophaga sp. oral taxon 338]EGD33175.1 hypothetical protein HMPREF9071_2368 [Capnocytophaga sp. oral taxon 338 str. F0234]